MKNQILPIDFDNAVKQKWSPDDCILAQASQRIDGMRLYRNGRPSVDDYDCGGLRLMFSSPIIAKIQRKFDASFQKPGDENKPELQALRASLPIDL